MNRFFKWGLTSLAVFVLVLGLATLVFRIAFPPAKLRKIIQEQVRTHLHRELQFDQVSLWVNGLTLERVRLSERPDFSRETFLAVESARVRWAWFPLLRHQLHLKQVVFERPQLNLIRQADGKTYNISDLLSDTNRPSASAFPTSLPMVDASLAAPALALGGGNWTWHVDAIRLKDGLVHFEDLSPARQSTTLESIQFQVNDFDPTRMRGTLLIDQFENSYYKARGLSLEWNLKDMDPAWLNTNGWMKLRQGPGHIDNWNGLVASTKILKLLFLPLDFANQAGVIRLGLPDVAHWPISGIAGDYRFEHGIFLIDSFRVESPQMGMTAKGLIELRSKRLDAYATLSASAGSLLGETSVRAHLAGTLDNPKVTIESLKKKGFQATIKNLLLPLKQAPTPAATHPKAKPKKKKPHKKDH